MTSTDPYPMVTVAGAGYRRSSAADSGLPPTRVDLDRLDDSPEALIALLRARLSEGGCVGIVRNTVTRAQQTAQYLREALSVDVVLAHSRFLSVDRLAREAWLRGLLGPPGGTVNRPRSLVVVGTQVLEQSLDVDFDLLITDLAPIDLMLQRIGRLHRHARPSRPTHLATPTCFITGTEWEEDPPAAVPGSQTIYGRAKLLRALGAIDRFWVSGIELPGDIPILVRTGYDPLVPPGPTRWHEPIVEADEKERLSTAVSIERATTYLLGEAFSHGADTISGWTADHVGEARDDTEGAAQVRDSEDGIEVIAVHERDGELFVMPGPHDAAGKRLPRDSAPGPWVARRLAGYTLRLPMEIARGAHGDHVIAHLEERSPAAWQESFWLRGQLVLAFADDLTVALGDYRLRYDPDQGLLHSRLESS